MKTLLTFLLATMLAFNASSQVLQNTYWRNYDLNGNPNLYWYFNQDSAFVSSDTVGFNYLFSFTVAGSLVTFGNDISPSCLTSDTGQYNISIQADTLHFNLVTDQCAQRAYFFNNTYFVQLFTGIEDMNPFSHAIISPNPSATGIFSLNFSDSGNLPQRIYVMTTDGRKIIEENYVNASTRHTINLQAHASGVYFLVMENEKGRRVMKLVK
jgi:hypothetical protein